MHCMVVEADCNCIAVQEGHIAVVADIGSELDHSMPGPVGLADRLLQVEGRKCCPCYFLVPSWPSQQIL